MPLVETFAYRYGRLGAEHDDLMQAGSLGLLNAIERYDPGRGEEFTAYAVPTIVGEIKHYVRDRVAPVKLPRPLEEAGARLAGARSDLTARLGRTPSAHELAADLGIAVDDLGRLEKARRAQILVDEPNGAIAGLEDGGRELDLSDERLQLAGAFRTLDQTERAIIYLRFVKDLSRKQTAKQLGISEGQLSRRAKAALAKLRRELERSASGLNAAAPAHPDSAGLPAAADAYAPGASGPGAQPQTRPEQKPKDRHSGRLMLRMPHSLHAELAEAAEREDVSLNQFITNTLAAAVRWRKVGEDGAARAEPRPPPPWLPAAIVSNLVVVAVAGIIAVVLLIVAWQHGW